MVTFRYLGIPKVRAMTTATSRFTRSDSIETDVDRSSRDYSGKSCDTSGRKRRNSLLQLRNITAKLLREESIVRTTSSLNETSPKKPNPNSQNNHRTKPKVSEEVIKQQIQDSNVIKAWVESTSKKVEVEASPIDIVAVKPSKHLSDSFTEETALCSALDIFSFENFCNAGMKCSQGPVMRRAAAAVNTEPIKVVGHTPALDDGFMVPREISFANTAICGCSSIPTKNEHHFMGKQKNKTSQKTQRGMLKRLLPFKPGKTEKSPISRVMRVRVYVDQPKQSMGSESSIEDSVLTMPKELEKSDSNTTI